MRSEEQKKITECIVADIFHWDFSGGEGWDACCWEMWESWILF